MLFGNAVTITADGPWQHLLYQLTGRKWGNLDVENETGCGIVPYVYKEKNLVNAVQWAVGLELLLLINDPWRIFLTTDHPNGGCFWRYPEIIQLLMDADFRKEQVEEAAAEGAEADRARRTWTASTRCPRSPSSPRPARPGRWACRRRGTSASAPTPTWRSINEQPGRRACMFSLPALRHQGRRGRRRGGRDPQRRRGHASSSSSPAYDAKIEDFIRPLFQQHYTMSFDNYPVEMERLERAEQVNLPAPKPA